MKKAAEQKPHVFGVGDLVASQDKNMYVIIEVGLDKYKFMLLQSESYELIGMPRHECKKGYVVEQPFYVFDQYHYLYNPKLK